MLNLAPSSTSNTLGESALSVALAYELVHVYKKHMRSLPDLNPDREPFRQHLLNFTGQISDLPELDELHILIYMTAGARLSTHSALIGTRQRPSTTGIGAGDGPDRVDYGLARERVSQVLASKLVTHLHSIIQQWSLSTVLDSFTPIWIAIDELGMCAETDEHHKFFHKFSTAVTTFLSSDECTPSVKAKIFATLDRVLACHPAMAYYAFLEDLEEISVGAVVPPAVSRSFVAASGAAGPLHVLSLDTLDKLFVDLDFAGPQGAFLSSTRERLLAHIKVLMDQVAFSKALPSQPVSYSQPIDDIQAYFLEQFSQVVDHWHSLAAFGALGARLPRGAVSLLRTLFKLEATHVVCVWTAQRDSLKNGTEVTELRARLATALSSWGDHATILMDNVEDEAETYEITSLVTQTLEFIKSSDVLDWAEANPFEASRLLKCLEHASFSRAAAGRLVVLLREKSTSPPSDSSSPPGVCEDVKITPEQQLASTMVWSVITELADSHVSSGGEVPP